MSNWSFRKALNEAMRAELTSDKNTFLFGLDVDDHKSIFGSTENFPVEFGADRVFGTPLSEDAMTGFAIGSAIRGKKPIHVHIRADFALLAANQIINMASNIHYLTAGLLNVPVTIRVVVGRGWGQGPQHSKAMHSMFAHFPDGSKDCPWYDGGNMRLDDARAAQYQGHQESALHRRLCETIRELAKADRRHVHSAVDTYLRPAIHKRGRWPDVYLEMGMLGRFALAVQLSKPFAPEIAALSFVH